MGRGKHLPTQLREVSAIRCVGFQDAVRDLGLHKVCGHMVGYSQAMVRQVLQGKTKSMKLLERIYDRRPDMFTLRYVATEVREWAKAKVRAEMAAEERGRVVLAPAREEVAI